MSIADNLKNVTLRIEKSEQKYCQLYNRPPNPVKLLGVSKTKPAEAIRGLYEAGLRCFGENYLQEALEKMENLSDLDIEWHFIGPIQSNKTRPIAEHFDWVQSVDRLKIAKRLHEQRPATLPPLAILLQVNINQEATKSGFDADEVLAAAQEISQFDKLQLRGIMAIPQAGQPEQALRATFQQLYQLYETLSCQYSSVDTLSMGMSGDFEMAIEEGANLVRVGTALFGQRT